MPAFSFKRKCSWCEQYEAAQRGEELTDVQHVMPAPWHQNIAASSPVTTGLLAINILVFVLMVASGASIMDPSGPDLLRWGSNFGPLTLSGQYWRLFTHMFVHIGLVHLFLNMWFLYALGGACERLLGSLSFAVMYILAGVSGGVASLIWHPQANSAGASGALFGILGAMIAAYKFGEFSMPRAYIQASLRSMLLCAGINLAWGMTGGIDNAAHVGGLIAGALIGFLLAKAAPEERDFGRRALIFALIGAVVVGSFAYTRKVRYGNGGALRIAQLMSIGNRDQAIRELEKKVAQEPNDSRWRLWLASAYSAAGDQTKAREQFEWMIAHGKPGDHLRDSALSAICWTYIQEKEYAKGERYFQQLADQYPGDVEAHFAIAELSEVQQKHEQAIAEFQKANSIVPDNPLAYAGMARNYSAIGKYSDSVAAYKKAIGLVQNNPSEVEALQAELEAVQKASGGSPKH